MSSRKLQSEIDRVLKRVQEGIEQFDSIWEKVKSATTPNLKEKYEADLKKEIKKLQRYRDQIKSWASSNDVKNKRPLLDARKSIENEMERFKALEKETKTKAYSKEGLSQKKKDPAKDPKYTTYTWIDQMKSDLRDQIEKFEQKIEAFKEGGKKKSKQHNEDIDGIQKHIEHHNWHLERLEFVREKLEKDEVSVKKVSAIKDDVEYYVQSAHQDPEFLFDEDVYESVEEGLVPKETTTQVEDEEDEDQKEEEESGETVEEELTEEERDEEYEEEEERDDEDEGGSKKPKSKGSKDRDKEKSAKKKEKEKKEEKETEEAKRAKGGKRTSPQPSVQSSPNYSAALMGASKGKKKEKIPEKPLAAAVDTTKQDAKKKQPPAKKTKDSPSATPTTGAIPSGPASPLTLPSQRTPSTGRPTPPATTRQQTGPKESLASLIQKQEELRSSPPLQQSRQVPPGIKKPTTGTATTMAGVVRGVSTRPAAPAPSSNTTSLTTTTASTSPSNQASTSATPQRKLAVPTLTPTVSPATPADKNSFKGGPGAAAASSSVAGGRKWKGTGISSTASSADVIEPSSQDPSLQDSTGSSPSSMPSNEVGEIVTDPASELPTITVTGPTVSDELEASVTGGSAAPLESPDDAPIYQSTGHYQAPIIPSQASGLGTMSGAGISLGSTSGSQRTTSMSSASLPGVPSVEEDLAYTLKLMQPSLIHLPEPSDTEKPRPYVPRNPHRTPSCFPSTPAPIFDDPSIFERFSTDTLFFIFYFQQGTQHQYLSARELKKQSWRYHKHFLTWFQRHDEPKLTTEEYERGTYLFFDYDDGWRHAIKTDFTFEYRHLEDELVNSIGP